MDFAESVAKRPEAWSFRREDVLRSLLYIAGENAELKDVSPRFKVDEFIVGKDSE